MKLSNAKKWGARALAGLSGMFVTGLALAQTTDAGTAAATAIDGSKTQINAVQASMIGALVLIVVFALIKRSMGK
jgi:hypothetical protein